MRKQFRSKYIDKLAEHDLKQPKHFKELDNLTIDNIEIYGFSREEVEERTIEEWRELERFLEGSSIWK